MPQILASPAFQHDGVLVITFDESDGPQSDATRLLRRGARAELRRMPGISGPGRRPGRRAGDLAASSRPSTWSTTPYNHYSLLASLEELFGLPKLGYAAAPGSTASGLDVYNAGV